MYIYFDHNVLIDLNKDRRSGKLESWKSIQEAMSAHNARPVISVWHMYENAKAGDVNERRDYNQMISELQPRFLSNNNFVKSRELTRYLHLAGMWPDSREDAGAFNDTVPQMWTSYGEGGLAILGEQFGDYVEHLAANAADMAIIGGPLQAFREEAKKARAAVAQNPDLVGKEGIINHEWIFSHLPERDEARKFLTLQYRQKSAQYAADSIGAVFAACPAVLADDLRYRNCLLEQKRIDKNDAADTQHVIVAAAYCDYFVTRDKPLREFINESARAAGLKCKGIENISEISGS